MNLVFIPVVVALTGMFGLAFALYGVLTNKRGGRMSKQQDSPARGRPLVITGPSTTVLPPGVKLISQGRTHMANVSLV